MKNKPNFFLITGVSQTRGVGGGDPPLGNFSHIIPFFSDNVPYATIKTHKMLSIVVNLTYIYIQDALLWVVKIFVWDKFLNIF